MKYLFLILFTFSLGCSINSSEYACDPAVDTTDGNKICSSEGFWVEKISGIDGGDSDIVDNKIATVTIIPQDPQTVFLGKTFTFIVRATNTAGDIIPTSSIIWTSDDNSVGTIDSKTGVFTAITNGTTTIRANVNSIEGTREVTVSDIPVATLSFDSAALVIEKTEPRKLAFIAKGKEEMILKGRAGIWVSSNKLIVSVDMQGNIMGLKVGTATITVTVENIEATINVEVVEQTVDSIVFDNFKTLLYIGGSDTLTATLKDARSNILIREIAWKSSNSDIASIDPTTGKITGKITGKSKGSTDITASSGGKSVTETLQVDWEPIKHLKLDPAGSITMTVGGTKNITLEVLNAAKTTITNYPPVTWKSSDSTVVNFASSTESRAKLKAKKKGTAVITATIGTQSINLIVTVEEVPVTSVIVTGPANIKCGQMKKATAEVKDGGGNILSRPLTWTKADGTGKIELNNGNEVTGDEVGTATITATAGGIDSAPFTVTINVGATKSISINSNTNNGINLTATQEDACGNKTLEMITWSSADATVDSNGKVTCVAMASGTVVKITATAASGTTGEIDITCP